MESRRHFTLEAPLAIHQGEKVILEFNSGLRAGNVLCCLNNDSLARAASQPPQLGLWRGQSPPKLPEVPLGAFQQPDLAPKGFVRSSSQYGCQSDPGRPSAATTPASLTAGQRPASPLPSRRAPRSSPSATGLPPPPDALPSLHLFAKGHGHAPSRSPDANHNGVEVMGGTKKGRLRPERRRLHKAAGRAGSPGDPQAAADLLTAGHGRSPAARGKRTGAGHCGGRRRPLAPSPALAAGPGRVPTPESEAPPTPLGARRGGRPGAGRPGTAQRSPRSDPARTPARPPLPQGGPLPGPAAAAPTAARPAASLTSAALRTDGRAGRPGQQAPRRAGTRRAGHRRSSARAAAAASRRAPLCSPITQRRGPASRAAEGGSAGGWSAATRRWRRLRRAENGSDWRRRLPGPPPSDCPASILAKLRPQPPARDTAPSPAAARHLGARD